MTIYKVHGLSAEGELQLRRVSASTSAEAERIARQTGLQHVIDVASGGFAKRPRSMSRSSGFDLSLFAHELVALLGAGLSLIETLETLAERQPHDGWGGGVLGDLVRSMQEGQAFSAALRRFPAHFPELFIASIAASEHTGEMVPALERYLRYHAQLGAARQKIISASLYPAMLCIVGGAVATFLLCFLVPRFSRVYEGMEDKLPLASRWLMHWGAFASANGLALLGAAGAGLAAIALLASRPAVRARLGAVLQDNPWIGAKVRLMQLSRFYRSLGLLLGGGIPLTKALRMAQGLLPLPLQAAAGSAALEVSQGRSLSDSLQACALTTPVALRLLRAGERNGQTAEMLEKAAAFHDTEMNHWIDRFTRLFEPALMLAIGLAIGGIVILLYLPIFELAGALQ